ncbi:MAG: helicase associated domain-containing protein [Schleiferiaceae bacterium]
MIADISFSYPTSSTSQEHGDCNVPQQYEKDEQLGRWVNKQRTAYIKRKLSEERIEMLKAVGLRLESSTRGGRPERSAPESTVNGDINSSSSTRQKRRKVARDNNLKVRTSSILDSLVTSAETYEGTYEYNGELYKCALSVGLSEMEHLIGVKTEAYFESINNDR